MIMCKTFYFLNLRLTVIFTHVTTYMLDLARFVSSYRYTIFSFLTPFLLSFLYSFLIIPTLLPSSLPSLLPCFLPSFLHSFLSSFLPLSLLSFLPSFLPSFIPLSLFSFLPSFFLPSFLPSILPSFLNSFLPFPSFYFSKLRSSIFDLKMVLLTLQFVSIPICLIVSGFSRGLLPVRVLGIGMPDISLHLEPRQ